MLHGINAHGMIISGINAPRLKPLRDQCLVGSMPREINVPGKIISGINSPRLKPPGMNHPRMKPPRDQCPMNICLVGSTPLGRLISRINAPKMKPLRMKPPGTKVPFTVWTMRAIVCIRIIVWTLTSWILPGDRISRCQGQPWTPRAKTPSITLEKCKEQLLHSSSFEVWV